MNVVVRPSVTKTVCDPFFFLSLSQIPITFFFFLARLLFTYASVILLVIHPSTDIHFLYGWEKNTLPYSIFFFLEWRKKYFLTLSRLYLCLCFIVKKDKHTSLPYTAFPFFSLFVLVKKDKKTFPYSIQPFLLCVFFCLFYSEERKKNSLTQSRLSFFFHREEKQKNFLILSRLTASESK